MTRMRTATQPVPADVATVEPLAPVKTRRRPVYLVASAAALLLGAFGAVSLWSAATSSVEVLVAKSTVPRGAVIAASDLAAVRVSLDPAVSVVPANQASTVVGKRAALDIARGGLLTPADLASETVPAKGKTVVGLALGRGMLPTSPLVNGDVVRVVQTPGAQGQLEGAASPVTITATVVAVTHPSDGQAALVDLLVGADAAPDLAARAATGKVAVVLDSRER